MWSLELLNTSGSVAFLVIDEFVASPSTKLGIAIVAGDDCPVFRDVRVELREMFFEGELF